MATRAPLHLHVLAHPKSEGANELASALIRRFVEPPATLSSADRLDAREPAST